MRLRTQPLPAPEVLPVALDVWRVTCERCTFEATAPASLRPVALLAAGQHAVLAHHPPPVLSAAFVVPHGPGSARTSQMTLRLQVYRP